MYAVISAFTKKGFFPSCSYAFLKGIIQKLEEDRVCSSDTSYLFFFSIVLQLEAAVACQQPTHEPPGLGNSPCPGVHLCIGDIGKMYYTTVYVDYSMIGIVINVANFYYPEYRTSPTLSAPQGLCHFTVNSRNLASDRSEVPASNATSKTDNKEQCPCSFHLFGGAEAMLSACYAAVSHPRPRILSNTSSSVQFNNSSLLEIQV